MIHSHKLHLPCEAYSTIVGSPVHNIMAYGKWRYSSPHS